MWFGYIASFNLRPYFLEELNARDPVMHTITGKRYESLLKNENVVDLEARYVHTYVSSKLESLHTLADVLSMSQKTLQ